MLKCSPLPPLSSGLGRGPLKAKTRVRTSSGALRKKVLKRALQSIYFSFFLRYTIVGTGGFPYDQAPAAPLGWAFFLRPHCLFAKPHNPCAAKARPRRNRVEGV